MFEEKMKRGRGSLEEKRKRFKWGEVRVMKTKKN